MPKTVELKWIEEKYYVSAPFEAQGKKWEWEHGVALDKNRLEALVQTHESERATDPYVKFLAARAKK